MKDTTGTLVPFESDEFSLDLIPDGDTFKVAAPSLARALGMRDAYRLLESIPDGEKGYTLACTPGGEQRISIVTEAGFYRALGQRQAARVTDPDTRARVERFQSWVYGTVLPQIRRTGGYSTQPALSDDEIVHRALAITTHRVRELESVVQDLTPDATAWRALADADGNFGVGDAAKILSQDAGISIGRTRLFEEMRTRRWIYRAQGRRGGWCAYQTQVDRGRLCERPGTPFLNRTTGRYELPPPTIRITVKGLADLHKLLATSSQLALPDGGAS